MILDKLLEKKDVLAYVNFRKKQLKQNVDVVYKTAKPEHREETTKRLQSRIGELSILADLIHSNKVKKRSIEISESLNDYGQKKVESTCNAAGTMYVGVDVGEGEEQCFCEKPSNFTEADKKGMKQLCDALGILFSELNIE